MVRDEVGPSGPWPVSGDGEPGPICLSVMRLLVGAVRRNLSCRLFLEPTKLSA